MLLTSAFDTNCFYGDSSTYSIDKIAKNSTTSDEVYHLTKDNSGKVIFNKDILDTNF